MSSSERLLILGATGQLGTDLVHAAAAAGVDHVGAGHEDIDVTQGHSVAAGIARYRPTIVINTAALHRVDACENDPHQAYLVNTVGALLVARAAARAGVRSVYISTDFVFSGDKPPAEDGRLTPDTAWVEEDPARAGGGRPAHARHGVGRRRSGSSAQRLWSVQGSRRAGGTACPLAPSHFARVLPVRRGRSA